MGRNQPCHCGSGKKFKMCCDSQNTKLKYWKKGKVKPTPTPKVKLFKSSVSESYMDECINTYSSICKDVKRQNIVDDVLFGSDTNLPKQQVGFNKDTPIKYVTHFQNLDEELQIKIKEVLRNKPITNGGCHQNSTYISSLIEGVEKVEGWINFTNDVNTDNYIKIKDLGDGNSLVKFVPKVVEECSSNLKDEGFKSSNDYGESLFVLDEKEMKTYIYHSWNKYGDKHFDVTLKFEWYVNDKIDWIEYYQQTIQPTPNNELKKTLIQVCDFRSLFNGSKDWCKNVGVMDRSVFNKVGFLKRINPFDGKLMKDKGYRGDLTSSDIQHQVNYLQMGCV